MDITSIKFPSTLVYIVDRAFRYNLITDIVIPKSVDFISNEAFYHNPLVNVEIKGSPTINYYAFHVGYDDNDVIDTFKYNGTCE